MRRLWGWGWVDWGRHDIAVDPVRFALASGGHAAFSGSVWVHNPVHRGGVPYADAATRARFNAARVSALTTATRSGVGRDATAAAHFGGPGRFGAVGREAAPVVLSVSVRLRVTEARLDYTMK
jgi:hypothetical protein